MALYLNRGDPKNNSPYTEAIKKNKIIALSFMTSRPGLQGIGCYKSPLNLEKTQYLPIWPSGTVSVQAIHFSEKGKIWNKKFQSLNSLGTHIHFTFTLERKTPHFSSSNTFKTIRLISNDGKSCIHDAATSWLRVSSSPIEAS